ncbi:MAG: response regulator [bacterium]|nr:response regulator [bacterium]
MPNESLKILLVEQDHSLREDIKQYLENQGNSIIEAEDSRDGSRLFEETAPDIVLTDLYPYSEDNIDFIKKVKSLAVLIPIIIISGEESSSHAVDALKIGAWNFINKPIPDMELLNFRILQSIERKELLEKNEHLSGEFEDRTVELRGKTEELVGLNRLLKKEIRERIFAEDFKVQSLENLKRRMDEVIQTISLIGEIRDPYTGGHQQRVALLSKAIAVEMKLPQEVLEAVNVSAMLHDIGKMSVPIEILCKPTFLSDIERVLLKEHPHIGYEILKRIEFPWPVANIVLQHHERLDGSGYPNSIKGDEIMLEARIIGVADVVEAMTFHRPYRSSLGIDKAMEEIGANNGGIYDADVVNACLRLLEREKHSFFEQ